MSFQPNSFSMPRDGLCVTDGQIYYNNPSRIEPKRNHQWLTECTGADLSKNKRQAIQANNSSTVSGIPDMAPSWQNASSLPSVSGQFTDSLFGSEHMRTFEMGSGNARSVDSGNMNLGGKVYDHQFDSRSAAVLSMSQTMEDLSPCLSSGKKVRVNQVGDNGVPASMGYSNSGTPASMGYSNSGTPASMGYSNSGTPASMGYSNSGIPASMGYSNNGIPSSIGAPYSRSDDNISLGPTYGHRNENTNSMGSNFSTGHTLSKEDSAFLSLYLNHHKLNENIMSTSQCFDKGDGSFMSIGQSYGKGNSNLMPSPSYGKANEKYISMAPAYNKPESTVSVAPSYGKGHGNLVSLSQSYEKPDFNFTAIGHAPNKGDSNILSMSQNYNKGECNTISFGRLPDVPEANPPGSIINNYNLLINNQNPVQASRVYVPVQKESVGVIPDSNVNSAPKISNKPTIRPTARPTTKATKKASTSNSFPTNVKSLLSTGILDGVSVKYVSWSREKSLKGYIKGTGYVCGCDECNFQTGLNAYEFEQHANCKTKHPNNHIYFENGKTIYAVVQELKNTPQERLFDAIQNVAGPQINHKNFNAWKASYQAATRELQRIYGKDGIPLRS